MMVLNNISNPVLKCLKFLGAILLLTVILSTSGYAQTNLVSSEIDSVKSKSPTASINLFSDVVAAFRTESLELNSKERFISNALIVVNNKDEKISFTLEIVVPASWKSIGLEGKYFELEAHDSLAIPVRLVPGVNNKQGNSVNIQALLISEDQELLSDAMFKVHRKKSIRWTLVSDQGNKIYFPVSDSVIPFSIKVNNEGNEKVDLLLSKKQLGTKIDIQEEQPSIGQKNYQELQLDPMEDTSLQYTATLRNTFNDDRRIDIENYSPTAASEEVRNTVFFQSQLSNNLEGNLYSGYRRMDFVSLSDVKTVNAYGSDVIPLTVDANVYNILGIQPVMRMDLRGTTKFSNEAMLSYQTLFNLTSYRYNNQLTNDVFYRAAYVHRKGDIQVGNISGGLSLLPISGRGVSASYFIRPSLRVGGYYVNNSYRERSGNANAYGGFLRYQLKNIGTTTIQAGQSKFADNNRTGTFANMSNSIRIVRGHQINFGFAVSRNQYEGIAGTKTGFSYFGGYSGSFLKNRLHSNLRGSVFSNEYSASRLPSSNYFHRSTFVANKKVTYILQNTLNTYKQYTLYNQSGITVENRVNYNQLFFNLNARGSRVMPGIFYNITKLNNLNLVYRGVSFDYSKASINGRTRFGTSFTGGYNTLPDYKEIPAYFTMQFSAVAQYKTISFNGRYFYGPQFINSPEAVRNTFKYPQSLFLSLGKQWQPRNRSFVFQSNASYTYMNQYNRHTLGIFPEGYYYTRNRWRFKLSAGYSFNSSRVENAYQNTPIFNDEQVDRVVTHNFFLNAGIRKDLGIPIPARYSKKHFANVTFTAFLDVNGNRIKDKNELPISNVVVRIGNDEVITNENGTAEIKNLSGGKYSMKAMSLIDLKGWYPLLEDSLLVDIQSEVNLPFVKGIKLNGSVVLQKARYSNVEEKPDLSRILVTAVDSTGRTFHGITDGEGQYMLYLPPGEYMLTLDETLIGGGFAVLKNNAELTLKGVENFNYNFYIIEKKRKVNIKKF